MTKILIFLGKKNISDKLYTNPDLMLAQVANKSFKNFPSRCSRSKIMKLLKKNSPGKSQLDNFQARMSENLSNTGLLDSLNNPVDQ